MHVDFLGNCFFLMYMSSVQCMFYPTLQHRMQHLNARLFCELITVKCTCDLHVNILSILGRHACRTKLPPKNF